jgi:hypothetical protein
VFNSPTVTMYRLDVFHPGAPAPTESVSIERAADALSRVSDLLSRHGDCERIVVMHQGRALFAVDCTGAPVAPTLD